MEFGGYVISLLFIHKVWYPYDVHNKLLSNLLESFTLSFDLTVTENMLIALEPIVSSELYLLTQKKDVKK